jgi:hypothetical protein
MHKFEHFFKTKPFFWILIPIFFLLKNSNIYFGFIPAGQLALLFTRYLLVALVIYVVVYWFTGKNAYKAAFYCTVFLSAYFFYSPLDEFIQAKTWLRPFNEYRYFLPFIFLCLLLILFSIHRMTRPPAKTILFINLLLSIFCLLETFRLSLKGLDPPKALLGIANKAAFFGCCTGPQSSSRYIFPFIRRIPRQCWSAKKLPL